MRALEPARRTRSFLSLMEFGVLHPPSPTSLTSTSSSLRMMIRRGRRNWTRVSEKATRLAAPVSRVMNEDPGVPSVVLLIS